jgi:hypothetical protein
MHYPVTCPPREQRIATPAALRTSAEPGLIDRLNCLNWQYVAKMGVFHI